VKVEAVSVLNRSTVQNYSFKPKFEQKLVTWSVQQWWYSITSQT